jgi:hypothetical protein
MNPINTEVRMKKIDNLKAVASDFGIPVGALIDMVTGYRGEEPTPEVLDAHGLLDRRIEAAEKAGLSDEYINGLKDSRKLFGKL